MAQYYNEGTADNSVIVLRTVPATQIYRVTLATIFVYNGSGGVAAGKIWVTDSADVLIWRIYKITLPDGAFHGVVIPFPDGLAVLPTEKIKIDSDAAGCITYGSFVAIRETL